jgi:hypothetical protein
MTDRTIIAEIADSITPSKSDLIRAFGTVSKPLQPVLAGSGGSGRGGTRSIGGTVLRGVGTVGDGRR